MSDGNLNLDAALDRLADMGVSALARDVFEPVNAAMMARAKTELETRAGAMAFFADYWSVARAAAAVFDEPNFAAKAAEMFFSGAPERCAGWAVIETVDGKPRLGISDLRDLATAASCVRDGNSGAFSNVLMDAMIARPDEDAKAALAAAEAAEPPKAPKAWGALRKDVASSALWARDELLDAEIERLVEISHDGASPEESWTALSANIEARARNLGNHGLAALFGIKAAVRIASEPLCLGWKASDWRRATESILLWSELAKDDALAQKRGDAQSGKVRDEDKRMLAGWTQALAGARERFASEIALAALERAAETGGDEASVALVEFLRDSFWGAGAAMSDSPDIFQDMAGALCNRFCRDGALACLPLPAAQAMLESMSTMKAASPQDWMAATKPETVQWLMEKAPSAVRGAQWMQLAAFARIGEMGPATQASWTRAIQAGNWGLDNSPSSMSDAESAKTIAKTLGASSGLGQAISSALSKFGVRERDSLGRLQDFLLALPDLGASDTACERASAAMAEALSALERESLAEAIAEPSADAPRRAPRANRL